MARVAMETRRLRSIPEQTRNNQRNHTRRESVTTTVSDQKGMIASNTRLGPKRSPGILRESARLRRPTKMH